MSHEYSVLCTHVQSIRRHIGTGSGLRGIRYAAMAVMKHERRGSRVETRRFGSLPWLAAVAGPQPQRQCLETRGARS